MSPWSSFPQAIQILHNMDARAIFSYLCYLHKNKSYGSIFISSLWLSYLFSPVSICALRSTLAPVPFTIPSTLWETFRKPNFLPGSPWPGWGPPACRETGWGWLRYHCRRIPAFSLLHLTDCAACLCSAQSFTDWGRKGRAESGLGLGWQPALAQLGCRPGGRRIITLWQLFKI